MSFKNEEKWVPGELTQKGENNRRLRFSMYSSVRDRPVSLRLSMYSSVRDRPVSLRLSMYSSVRDRPVSLRLSMHSSVRDRPVSLRLSAYSAVRDRQVSITLRSTLYARYQDLREIVLLVDVQSNGLIRTYLFRQ
jgi:hypothetical protein